MCNNKINQYRPTSSDEERLLQLTDWINNEETRRSLGEYITKQISNDIKLGWEFIDYREELCKKNFDSTKEYLLKKYYSEGQLSNTLVNRLEEYKEFLLPEIYSYFQRKAFNPWEIILKMSRDKYLDVLMMEAGVLPKIFIKDQQKDIEKECDLFIQLAKSTNILYENLLDWMKNLQPNDEINEECIARIKKHPELYIYELSKCCKNTEGIQTVIADILKNNNISSLKEKQNFKVEIKDEEHCTKLYPNQERFYKNLEKWATEIRNPNCREWIISFLKKGRQLPFHRIKVFKYMNNSQKAKDFLIDKYEEVLKFRNEKHLYYKKKHEIYSKVEMKKTKKAIDVLVKDSINK